MSITSAEPLAWQPTARPEAESTFRSDVHGLRAVAVFAVAGTSAVAVIGDFGDYYYRRVEAWQPSRAGTTQPPKIGATLGAALVVLAVVTLLIVAFVSA